MNIFWPIETERLILRAILAVDEAAVQEYAADPEVSRFMEWGPNTPEMTHGVIEEWLTWTRDWPQQQLNLAIELRSSAGLIGVISLHVSNADPRKAVMGYTFHPNYWGHGYATEAANAMINAGFSELGLSEIAATCDVRNKASYRVMEKIGMQRTDHFLKDVWQKGEYRNSYRYAICGEDWATMQATAVSD